jgi:hypothetical protein
MRRTITDRVVVGLLAAVGLVGCAVAPPSTRGPRKAPPSTAPPAVFSPTPRPVTMADAGQCPVTQPSAGPAEVPPSQFFGWGSSYGNGKLWVGGLWPNGVINADPSFVEKDGAVGMKFGWWRAVAGDLTVTGRRLDGPAPPARGVVPDGYGQSGFQASGVYFPTEGCWEITGEVGTTSLTFVTFVIKQG